MTWILLISSRIFSRFDLWTQTVLALDRIRPSTRLDENFRLRFSYACLVGSDSPRIRRAFAGMLRRDLDISAANNLWLAFTAWCLGRFHLAQLINKRTAKLGRESPEAVIAAREAQFAAGIFDGGLVDHLSNVVDQLCKSSTADGPWIVVPLSARYSHLFQLWKQQVDRHAKGRTVVLAMDGTAAEIAKKYGVCDIVDLSPYFGFDPMGRVEDYSKRHLWVLRVLVLQELVSRGKTVISLDLDAVLVGDLEPMLQAMPDADIVAQRDYSIPVDVARKLGFILCCGFMRIRSNPATIRFMQSYATQVILEMDDQTALNHLLLGSGVQCRVTTHSYMSFRSAGVSWACPDTSLVSRDASYGSVIRHFQQQGQSIEDLKGRLGLGPVR
ncbi:MAG: putative nucleotide-diphospho-sugar transferase [Acidobacteriaceae bacterium]